MEAKLLVTSNAVEHSGLWKDEAQYSSAVTAPHTRVALLYQMPGDGQASPTPPWSRDGLSAAMTGLELVTPSCSPTPAYHLDPGASLPSARAWGDVRDEC